MADDLARLGIQVDSSQAAAAAGNLDKLSASAAGAQKATDSLAVSNKGATAALSGMSAVSGATQKATDALKASVASGAAVTSEQIKAVGGWAAAQKIMQENAKDTAVAISALGATQTQVGADAVKFVSLQQGINESLNLTDTAYKKAVASAAVFGTSLKGEAAIAASTSTATKALTAEQVAAGAAAVRFASLQQGINSSLGLTGESFKKASASAAIFGASLEGQAAIAASTAAKTDAAYESTAVAAVESAAVQNAANDSVALNSIAVREAIVSLRDVMRGQTSRLGSSLSILIQQFVPLTAETLALGAGILTLVGGYVYLRIAADNATEAHRLLQAEISGVGRMSGVTSDQITAAAENAAAQQNKSISTTQAWAQSYATSGKISGDVLIELTNITSAYAAATGEKASAAVKELTGDFSDGAKGVISLNDKLGILNATQLTNIEQLANEGNRLAAQTALYAALDKALDTTAQHAHGLAGAWQDVTTWAENAYHSMIVSAGGGTLAQQLAQAQQKLNFDKGVIFPQADLIAKDQSAVDALTASIAKYQEQQDKSAYSAKLNQASTAGLAVANSVLPDSNTLTDLTTKLSILQKAKDSGAQAGDSAATIQKFNDAYQAVADTIGRVTTATGQYIPLATRQHEIAVLQAQESATTNNADKSKLATQIALLKTGSDIITNQEALTKARDAGNIVANKATQAIDSQINNAGGQLKSVHDQVKAQLALNGALASGTLTLADYDKEQYANSHIRSIIAQQAKDEKTATDKNATQAQRDKALADAQKLAPIIQQMKDAWGNMYAADQVGKDIVSILQGIEGPLEKYQQTLAAIQALQKGGDINSGQAQAALSQTAVYKNASSAISAMGANNPFGASAQINVGFNVKAVQNQATQYRQAIDDAAKSGVLSAQQAADARVEIETQAAQKIKQAYANLTTSQLALGAQAFGGLADSVGALVGKSSAAYQAMFAISKAFAIAQASINMQVAISQALTLPFPESLGAWATVASDASQIISAIASVAAPKGFATGIIGISGPGTGTSDSILARLSNGESVITAQATRNNRNTLAAMNAGANFDAHRSSGDVITVAPVFQIDARGAQQGVGAEIKKQLAEVAPAIVSAAVASAKRQSPNWVASANKKPRVRAS